MTARRRPWFAAPRFSSLLGVLIGAAGGAVYLVAGQLWPSSIAVVLAMLATALLDAAVAPGGPTEAADADDAADGKAVLGRATRLDSLGLVFAVIIKYSALMALSSASSPLTLSPPLVLGLIMIAGHAASRALAAFVKPASPGDLAIALVVAAAPAALIGVPGLAGIAAAIAARLLLVALAPRIRALASAGSDLIRQSAEICFYLGALAAWAYV
jgi:adenosylcobinamide-GDP ribazoletransferase